MVKVCRREHSVCRTQRSGALVIGVIGIVIFGLQPAALAAPIDDTPPQQRARFNFNIVEASISDIHQVIKRGHMTCRGVVQAYIDRAAAYNGACTQLITADGAPIPPATGAVRAGTAVEFPTQTVAASSLLPDLNQYVGLPIDFGRMEPAISDPSVQQQQGMRVGIPNAGQVNALETLNLRGERSVACKASCDAPPSSPLPPHCPLACEAFRHQPDALERASELDAQYRRNLPLDDLPMYCIPVIFKDPYDTKDMRSTANSDVNFAMDAPPFDSTIAAQLRAKGAIIYGKSTAHEFNAGPGNPGGPNTATRNYIAGNQAISTWGGQACNPYDTERVPRGSSSGAGVAVAANLATVGICEQTNASCQGPASRNNLVLILATSGILPDNGGIGNQYLVDRPGIYGKTVKDAAIVLDSIMDPNRGYFDPRSIYTALPTPLTPPASYTSFVLDDTDLKKKPKPLTGMRVGIVREFMQKSTPNTLAIIAKMDTEFKTILRDKLGAQLVESVEPQYGDDPDVPNMTYTFADAFSEILPRLMPDIFSTTTSSGALQFAVPGFDVTSYAYLLALSRRQAPLSANINLRTITGSLPDVDDFKFAIEKYLLDRGDDRIRTWADWVANAKFRDDSSRAGAENWVLTNDIGIEGRTSSLARSAVARMAIIKVMRENNLNVLVNPENTTPPGKIGGPSVGPNSCCGGFTALLQIPQMVVPAGYIQNIFEGRYVLNSAKTNYNSVLNTQQTVLPNPMPISMMFWAGPGDEPTLLKVTSAYETVTKHRVPPPAFGPLP